MEPLPVRGRTCHSVESRPPTLPYTRLPTEAPTPLALLALLACTGRDRDGDGYSPDDGDCDDRDPDAFPHNHAPEIPGDGLDVDCDGHDACRDLNCDGWADLVFANTYAEIDGERDYRVDSVVYFGSADGFSEAASLALPTTGAMGAALEDLDGDGYLDVALNQATSDGSERHVDSLVFWGTAEGPDTDAPTGLPTVGAADVEAADVDGDGLMDLVFSNRYDGSDFSEEAYTVDSYVYWGSTAGFDEANRGELPTVGAARAAVADLDGDGHDDIAFAHGTLFDDQSSIHWGPDFSRVTTLPTTFAEGVTAADLDDDGHIDLVFSNWCGGQRCTSTVYWGSASGPSQDDSSPYPTLGATDAKAADLNGDGRIDLVFANSFGEGLDPDVSSVVYWGGQDGPSTGRFTELPTPGGAEVEIGDLDEDGHPDLVFASFYGTDSAPAESLVYWGSADGYSAENRTALPTVAAAGVAITPGAR